MNTKNQGFFFALVAAILFGASTPAAKFLLKENDPWLTAGLLYFGSGVGIFSLSLVFRIFGKEISHDEKLTQQSIPWIAAATFFGGICGPVLLMIGLSQTTATSSSLLLNLESVFTTLLAWFVFKENFDRRIALGTLCILLGGIFLSWGGNPNLSSLRGPLFVAAACLCWALDNNFTRKISGHHPVQLVTIKSIIAGGANISLALALGSKLPGTQQILEASVVGLLGYGFSLVSFILALRHIGAARTGAYFSLAPFVGSGISIVFLGDNINSIIIIATCFMAMGVWLHLTENHGHTHEHNEIEHTHTHEHDEHHLHEHSDPASNSNSNSNSYSNSTSTSLATTKHSHPHKHTHLRHAHTHFPDIHHQHSH